MKVTSSLLDTLSSIEDGPIARYQQLRDQIADWCMRQSSGERLPSERMLAEVSGLNRRTVRRAVAELMAEGLVERTGQTTRVTRPDNNPQVPSAIAVGLVLLDNYAERMVGSCVTMLATAAHDEGLAITVHPVASQDPAVQVAALRDIAQQSRGLLLYGVITEQAAQVAADLPVPAVLLGMPDGEPLLPPPGHVVMSNARAMGELATRALVARGHKRVGFFCGPTPRGMWNERWLAGCRGALNDCGLSLAAADACVINESECVTHIGTKAAAYYSTQPTRPTAYVTSTTLGAQRFLSAMADHGTPIDRSAMAIGAARQDAIELQVDDLAMVCEDSDTLSAACMRTLRLLIDGRGPHPGTQLVPFSLYNIPEYPFRGA